MRSNYLSIEWTNEKKVSQLNAKNKLDGGKKNWALASPKA